MEQLPEIGQEEFAKELLTETLQKVAMLEQQNLHLRMQIKKMQEPALAEVAEADVVEILSD